MDTSDRERPGRHRRTAAACSPTRRRTPSPRGPPTSCPIGLTIGGGARYIGQLQRGTDGAIGTPTFVESYWVFDAMASYRINKNFELQLNVYNLFDEEYVAAINKSGYRYIAGRAALGARDGELRVLSRPARPARPARATLVPRPRPGHFSSEPRRLKS